MRAYSGLCDPQLAVGMLAAEVVAREADVLSIAWSLSVEDALSRLYHMLVLLTRSKPLNVGSEEGLVAWRRSVDCCWD